MTEPKVAKILDEYNLVLNKGKDDNIEIGQKYLVYQQTEEIIDPDTGKILECLFVPKGKGIIIRVQDKISILRSLEWEKPSSLAEAFAILAQPQKLKAFERPAIGDCAKFIEQVSDCKEEENNEESEAKD